MFLPALLATSILALSLSGAEVLKGLMHSYGAGCASGMRKISSPGLACIAYKRVCLKWRADVNELKTQGTKAILICYHIKLTNILALLSSEQASPRFTTI